MEESLQYLDDIRPRQLDQCWNTDSAWPPIQCILATPFWSAPDYVLARELLVRAPVSEAAGRAGPKPVTARACEGVHCRLAASLLIQPPSVPVLSQRSSALHQSPVSCPLLSGQARVLPLGPLDRLPDALHFVETRIHLIIVEFDEAGVPTEWLSKMLHRGKVLALAGGQEGVRQTLATLLRAQPTEDDITIIHINLNFPATGGSYLFSDERLTLLCRDDTLARVVVCLSSFSPVCTRPWQGSCHHPGMWHGIHSLDRLDNVTTGKADVRLDSLFIFVPLCPSPLLSLHSGPGQ